MSIRIDGTNTTANPGITGSDTDTGLQFGTDEVKVVTGGTEQATFDDSGNLVLDGGSDVRIELGSNGTTATNDRNHIRGDGDNIKYNSCDAGQHIFEVNGTERLKIFSNGSATFTTNSTDTSVTDLTQLVLKNSSNAANTMAGIRFEASSNSDSDYFIAHKKHGAGTGADLIVQRGSNERLRFIESGGISFNGDTAAANALDDYEEGTWTPTIRVEGQGSNAVTDEDYGHYVKVGKVVHCWGQTRLDGTPAGRSTGAAIELRGFPFAHRSGYDKISHDVRVHGWRTDSTYGGDITFIMRMLSGQQLARIEALQAGYDGTRNASLTMQDNTLYGFSFTYEVA